MSSAKKLNTKRPFSVKDMVIQKYNKNKEKIKALTKENDAIKQQWLHSGSFSTNNFIVTVKKSRFKKAPNKEELFYMLGEKEGSKLLVNKTRTDFKVEEK